MELQKERERKFLVDMDAFASSDSVIISTQPMHQVYLVNTPELTVRLRALHLVHGEKQYEFTVKSERSDDGQTCKEYNDFLEGMNPEIFRAFFSTLPAIEKTRHTVRDALSQYWSVDVMHGANQGLHMAEFEYTIENPELKNIPEWVVAEVTGDARYYNACLIKHPYSQW